MKINTDHKAVLLIAVFDVPGHQKAANIYSVPHEPIFSFTLFSQVKAKSLQHTDCLIATH